MTKQRKEETMISIKDANRIARQIIPGSGELQEEARQVIVDIFKAGTQKVVKDGYDMNTLTYVSIMLKDFAEER